MEIDLNLFDVAALAILAFAVIAGIRTGALPQVGGIAGAVGALLLLLQLAPWILEVTRDLEPLPRALVVLAIVLGGVIAGEALGSTLGRALAEGLGNGVVSGLDRAAGGVLGAAQAVLIIWLAGGLLAASGLATLGRTAANSTAVRLADRYLPSPTEVVGDIAGVIDASGLPDVFVGLEPVPLEPVDPPSDPRANEIAGLAAASTARVTARACDRQVTGTAAVVAGDYLVSNAHVVAGASTIRVELPSGTADATVVLFDPELDVALLHAPSIDAPSLRFASGDPGRGTLGAALGYAGGGPLVVLPAAVTGGYEARGRDIYGEDVVVRDILELRAAVEPGDSGGPLVLEDGTIGGVVFAESRTDENVGYALTPTSVAVRIQPAIGRTGAVDLGDCLP
ncbi:MAG TPA: MarP family serine protease [Candidatus Limnocylindrales bacterium]|nr:MarP family serine protease [Candidatus Limnocylindrales bacterium]